MSNKMFIYLISFTFGINIYAIQAVLLYNLVKTDSSLRISVIGFALLMISMWVAISTIEKDKK